MSNLDIYEQYGFKFLLCNADKTPAPDGFLIQGDPRCWNEKEQKYTTCYDWKQPENQISKSKADEYQKIGKMIGAWIPEGVIVIDIDRHKGKRDGAQTIKQIEEKYHIDYDMYKTFTVSTANNGRHLFYTTDKEFKQGTLKEPDPETGRPESIGIDIKTNKGYVIAAGSPGYKIYCDYEPKELILQLEQFIFDYQETENKKKKSENNNQVDLCTKKKKLPLGIFKRIINKIDVSHFADNDRWLEFIMGSLAIAGNTPEVHEVLEDWSKQDSSYSDDKSVIKRIESFDEIKEITAGTFIHFLREENLSQHIINQVIKLDNINTIIVDAENSEITLPFPDPDYQQLSLSSQAQEFFHTQGNTSGAALLAAALKGMVIYCDAEKSFYYFDGNRFIEFYDYYGIVYTIIYRTMKLLFNQKDKDKEDTDRMIKCISAINSTTWKIMTWKEFCHKDEIFEPFILWDSPMIKETITTVDGVIDFKNGEIENRKGLFEEYRKSYIEYSSDEIIKAENPETFLNFFNELFLDEETRNTAKYCISMAISGNSGKRLFQMWQGIGSNGKSTLLETIKHVLGTGKAYAFNSELLLENTKPDSYKPEMAKFQGKYFCYAVEARKGARLSQNLVKLLSGDDTISGKFLYKDPIDFEATWQLIYAVNDLPAIHGDDHAFLDRLLVIPFNMFFYKDEEKKRAALKRGVKEKYLKKANNSPKFKESLYKEKSGIIKWMIDNYNYLNNELNGVIPESVECKMKKSVYVDENDDVGVFIENLCVIDETGSNETYTQNIELAEAFRDFTGQGKRGDKSIIADIKKYHSVLTSAVKWVDIKDNWGTTVRKQKTVLQNIKLLDKEIQEEKKEEHEIKKEERIKRKETIEELEQTFDDEALGNVF